jgi:hypothetical protein
VEKSQKCFPRLKPIVSLHFFRWTEVQLPLLKQGLPPNVPTDKRKLAGRAPRAVGTLRRRPSARLKPCPDEVHNARAGESTGSVNGARWVLFMAHLNVRPTGLESKASHPSESEGWGTRKFKGPRRKDGASALAAPFDSGSGDFGVGGPGDCLDFLD